MATRVALIAGVTGIVGSCLVEILDASSPHTGGPWKVYGIARRPQPHWLAAHRSLEYIQCDLLDQEQTHKKLAPLVDITDVFYVTWTSRNTEEENCAANGAMLRNTLDAIMLHAKKLKHICLQTGIKHYIGPPSMIDRPTNVQEYHEGLPRLPELNFYYVQEDVLFEYVNRRRGEVSWSVHRPALIFGLSPDSQVNFAMALAVYASICKHEGKPLLFTGTRTTWEARLEASDANLIAEQELWATTNDDAKNQAFNVSNGDEVTWKEVWSVVAQSFGIEQAPVQEQGRSIAEMMLSKPYLWDEIVSKHSLQPMKLTDLTRGWHILDFVLLKLPSGKSNMTKSKEFGFKGSRDTKESLLYWFKRMREKRFIPSFVIQNSYLLPQSECYSG